VAAHAAGDHTIVVAAVDTVEIGGREDPLIFFGGRYESLAAGLRALETPGATLAAS
jgi:flavin reductase (DIM6/NTAB) family NADH-FMN oxidoreductase RutF